MNKVNHFFLFPLIACLFCCSNSTFSEDEINILKKISFDQNIISRVKKSLGIPFSIYTLSDQLIESQESTDKAQNNTETFGIAFTVSVHDNSDQIALIKKILSNSGYYAYITDLASGEDNSTLVIAKANDKFDIIRYEQTH